MVEDGYEYGESSSGGSYAGNNGGYGGERFTGDGDSTVNGAGDPDSVSSGGGGSALGGSERSGSDYWSYYCYDPSVGEWCWTSGWVNEVGYVPGPVNDMVGASTWLYMN